MIQYVDIHPDNPQERLIEKIASELKNGAVIAYPTSSGYALGCALDNRNGVERIRQIRKLEEKQDFTLMCASISQASTYAKIDDSQFRLIKSLDEEKFTFLLRSLPDLPKKIHSKRNSVGIRIAKIPVISQILETLGEPILSTSLLEPTDDEHKQGIRVHHGFSRGLNLQAFDNGWKVKEALENLADFCVEIGEISAQPTTVLDLSDGEVKVIRKGAGEIDGLEIDE